MIPDDIKQLHWEKLTEGGRFDTAIASREKTDVALEAAVEALMGDDTVFPFYADQRKRIAELEVEVKELNYVVSQQPSIVKLEDQLTEAKRLLEAAAERGLAPSQLKWDIQKFLAKLEIKP